MARNWETESTNWEAADANYLDGRIRDDSAENANDGTVINTILHGDIIQFFLKQLRDASITPNGEFDNESNGYQLDEALVAKMIAQFTTPEGIAAIVSAVTASTLFNRIRTGTLTAATGVSLSTSQIVQYQSFLLIHATFTITSGDSNDPGDLVLSWGSDFPTTAVTWRYSATNDTQQNVAAIFLSSSSLTRNIRLDNSAETNIEFRLHATIPLR